MGTSESQIVKTEASNAENVEQEKEKEKKIAMKEREETAAFSPTLSKNPSSMTRISTKIISRIGNKTKLLLLLLRRRKSSSKQLKNAEEKKAIREKVKRDSKKIKNEPTEYANEEKKTTTEKIVKDSNKTDKSKKESSKMTDDLIEEKKK